MSSVLLYETTAPELAVVLTTPGTFKSVALTIAHLRAQTRRQKLELVLVVSSVAAFGASAEALHGFGVVRLVEVGEITSAGAGNARGVLAATAPLVALSEDHAFPAPDWAQNFIEAHRQSYSVVGPLVSNFNGSSAVSRADFLIGYGLWFQDGHPTEGREVAALPGHNSCYKREVLLALGAELEAMLESEIVLHWRLHAQGHRLWLEPKVRVRHINFALWSSWLPVQFWQGRLFAGSRAANWGRGRRFCYALASPLIPAVRLLRVLRTTHLARRPGTLAALVIGLLVDASGQLCGYVRGKGRVAQHLKHIEFERVQHITRLDRQQVAALEAQMAQKTFEAETSGLVLAASGQSLASNQVV